MRFPNASSLFFYLVITVLNKSSFLVKLLFTVTAHFIQGLFGLSEPFKAKFIEEINCYTKHRHIFVYIADRSFLKSSLFSVAPEEGQSCQTEVLGIKFNIFSRPVSRSIGFIMDKCPAKHHPTPPSAFTWRKLTPPNQVNRHG